MLQSISFPQRFGPTVPIFIAVSALTDVEITPASEIGGGVGGSGGISGGNSNSDNVIVTDLDSTSHIRHSGTTSDRMGNYSNANGAGSSELVDQFNRGLP